MSLVFAYPLRYRICPADLPTLLRHVVFSAEPSKSQVGGEPVHYKSILKESTSNDPWNVSNSKLQVLADHTHVILLVCYEIV